MYGLHDEPLRFIKSYLKNQKQVVCVNGNSSEEALVRWAVPQGLVLGPLLFLIGINDLALAVKSKIVLYADDTTFI